MSFNNITGFYEGYIYKITNRINSKSYIGQTLRTCEERWYEHTKNYTLEKSSNSLYRAFKKYGIDNFTFEIICKIEEQNIEKLQDKLNSLEIHYIKKYNTHSHNGYNRTDGGNYTSLENAYHIPIDVYYKNGKLYKHFNSMSEASKQLGCNMSSISQCCNGIIGYTDKYVFRKNTDDFDLYEIDRKSKYKKEVYQFDKHGTLISKYSSIKEAAQAVKKAPCNITDALDNEIRTCADYWWSTKPIFYGDNAFQKSVKMFSLDGQLLKTYKRLYLVKNDGFNVSGVQGACIGRLIQSGGYVWRYENDDFYKLPVPEDKKYCIQKKQLITQYDMNGRIVNTFHSYLDASESTNIPKDKIMRCCNKVLLSVDGYVFRKNNEAFYYNDGRSKNRIIQYDLSWNFINIFTSIEEASKYTHIGVTNITKCCSGKRESIKGYIFKRYSLDEAKRIQENAIA